MQFHAQPGIILARRFGIAASLRLTRGSNWTWGIALNGVSAKIQPRGFFSRAEDKLKLSDDEIEKAFTRSARVVHLYFTRYARAARCARSNPRL
jgi:hypothetical protein